jgi:hypothetical protein
MENKDLDGALNNFYNKVQAKTEQLNAKAETSTALPPIAMKSPIGTSQPNYVDQMNKIDPDLTVGFEIISLPSKGIFYSNRISEVPVEYMTSKDEDIMTTPSLLENNTALDVLLKSKVKSKDLKVDDMLAGDKNAITIFLRASAYGYDYDVDVRDPRTGKYFKATIDLSKIKYKEVTELPDEMLEFSVELPRKKKIAKFKLLCEREVDLIIKKAKAMQEAYKFPYNPIGQLLLKAQVTQIGHERSPDYINRFLDAISPLDANVIKKKIVDVTPNVDLKYTFTASDGYQFTTPIEIGIDFFFPAL